MKTIARPTGTTTSQTPKMTAPRIVSQDAENHLHWIYRNTIWQSYGHTVDDDGVPYIFVQTPFPVERAFALMVGERQPSSVTENDIIYDKSAAFAELAELLETATVEEYNVPKCGIWKKITFRNAKFSWQN